MEMPVLELHHLTKTYVIGANSSARKALKAIQKAQRKFEKDFKAGKRSASEDAEIAIRKAQQLFAEEQFDVSYNAVTGKHLRQRRDERGVVVHALNGVDLNIQPGDLVAVMGPSGSGKSTLLNMLGLLDSPTAGRIILRGRDVTAITRRELPDIRSRELGFVFQAYNLIPTMTAIENVMLPLRYSGMKAAERQTRARKALEQVGLGNRMDHSPGELSGGQQQRVAIARAIVNHPAIVFGDELTGELDSKMTAEIMELINRLNRHGLTFVIVTHNPEVAKHCRRIIFMKDGQIVKEAHRETFHLHYQFG